MIDQCLDTPAIGMSMSDFRGYICAGVWCLLFWGATSTNEIQRKSNFTQLVKLVCTHYSQNTNIAQFCNIVNMVKGDNSVVPSVRVVH